MPGMTRQLHDGVDIQNLDTSRIEVVVEGVLVYIRYRSTSFTQLFVRHNHLNLRSNQGRSRLFRDVFPAINRDIVALQRSEPILSSTLMKPQQLLPVSGSTTRTL